MRLLKQIIGDIFQELSWIVLYGIVLTVILLPLDSVVGWLQESFDSTQAVLSYDIANTISITTRSLDDYTSSDSQISNNQQASSGNQISPSYLRSLLSPEGKGGLCLISTSSLLGVDQVIILAGTYVDVVDLEENGGDTYYLSADVASDRESGTIKINGEDRAFNILPEDFCFYRLRRSLISSRNMDLSRTMVVLTRDYDTLVDLMGGTAYSNSILDGLIMVGASDRQIAELLSTAYGCGLYTETMSMADVLKDSSLSGLDYAADINYLVLIVGSSASLFAFMLLNVYSLLKSKMHSYSLSFLFGAPRREIFVRMIALVVSFQILPLTCLLLCFALSETDPAVMAAAYLTVSIPASIFVTVLALSKFDRYVCSGMRGAI